MKIAEIFTEYDSSLEANGFRDPMGLQVIWSAVGQEIFGRSITVASNDIRSFTINLFHHWVIRELVSGKRRLELSSVQKENYQKVGLEASLVIFLENLLILVLVNKDADCSGILGAQNARKNERNTISVQVDDEILVRQVSLGINGRYRTPFLQAKLFDSEYRYDDPGVDSGTWSQVNDIFKNIPSYKTLSGKLISLLSHMFKESKWPPHINLSENIYNDEILSDLYIECFVTNKPLAVEAFTDFWKKKLQFTSGAAGYLYEAAKNKMPTANNIYEINLYSLVQEASISSQDDSEEQKKIDAILNLEPFLITIAYLFNLICAAGIDCIEDLRGRIIEDYISEDSFLVSVREQATAARTVIKNIERNHYGKSRLEYLCGLDFTALQNMVQGIYDYHLKVMEARGNSVWFSCNDGKIRHNVKEFNKKAIRKKDIANLKDNFDNSYYLHSLLSICKGLEGQR